MKLHRRLVRVKDMLVRRGLVVLSRQQVEPCAWLRTLSDEELEAVARQAKDRVNQEATGAYS